MQCVDAVCTAEAEEPLVATIEAEEARAVPKKSPLKVSCASRDGRRHDSDIARMLANQCYRKSMLSAQVKTVAHHVEVCQHASGVAVTHSHTASYT